MAYPASVGKKCEIAFSFHIRFFPVTYSIFVFSVGPWLMSRMSFVSKSSFIMRFTVVYCVNLNVK